MSVIELDIEQLDALSRARDGYVRRRETGWVATVFGIVLVYDSLSTLPDGAVQVIFTELEGWGLIDVDGELVSITEEGLVALGTGRVSDE